MDTSLSSVTGTARRLFTAATTPRARAPAPAAGLPPPTPVSATPLPAATTTPPLPTEAPATTTPPLPTEAPSARPRMPTIPTTLRFDGASAQTRSHLQQVDTFAAYHNLSDAERVRLLPGTLVGPALTRWCMAVSRGPPASFDDARRLFIALWAPAGEEAAARSELQALRQGPGETVDALNDRLLDTLQRLPEGVRVEPRALFFIYVEALQSADAKKDCHRALEQDDDPDTLLHRCMAVAKLDEQVTQVTRPLAPQPAPAAPPSTPPLAALMNLLAPLLATPSTGRGRGRSGRGGGRGRGRGRGRDITCFRCLETGHYQRDCPNSPHPDVVALHPAECALPASAAAIPAPPGF